MIEYDSISSHEMKDEKAAPHPKQFKFERAAHVLL